MTARDTYNATLVSAGAAKHVALAVAETAKQTTVDASNSVVGYTLQFGNNVNLIAAVKSAAAAKAAAVLAAEQAKQASIAAARDTLRGTGDLAPV